MKLIDLLEKFKVIRDYGDKRYRAGQEDGYEKGRWVKDIAEGAEHIFIQELKDKTTVLEQIAKERGL
jgi:hypothetical protein